MDRILTPLMHYIITDMLVLLLANELPLEYHIADNIAEFTIGCVALALMHFELDGGTLD